MEQQFNTDSLKGQLLIAMPNLADPNFSQTVTCMCEHTPQGALGLVINRLHPSLSLTAIMDELELPCSESFDLVPLYIGGPVHLNEIFILHGPPFNWKGCHKITESIAISNTKDVLEKIAVGRGPDSFNIYIGCAGWGNRQLDSEIRENAWLTTPVTDEIIFDVPVENRWEASLKILGVDPNLISGSAGHA